jgi:diacylglycerol O-acyltransferase / wax synthase
VVAHHVRSRAARGTRVTWERLGVGDLIPLLVEERGSAMNIALAGLLDAGPLVDGSGRLRVADLRAALDARLDRVPALRRRILRTRPGQGRPVWVDDAGFDIARHITAVALPGAGETAFLSWAASEAAHRLDRTRPLWRIAFASGLAGGRAGVVIVVHHAVADGVAGAALAATLLDSRPDQSPPPSAWQPTDPPSGPDLAREALATRATGLRRLARRPARPRTDLGDTLAALRATAPVLDLPAPRTADRRAAAVSWPLERVRAAAHAHAATINDVALAAVVAAVGRVAGPRRVTELRVSVPVAGAPGTQNAGGTLPMVLTLPAGDADPARTLAGIAAVTARAKAGRDRGYPGLFASPLVPMWFVRLAVRWMAGHTANRINLYVTNVPGPPEPLWLCGSRLHAGYPLPPLVAGVPLAVGVLSYAGTLTLVVNGGPDLDVDAFTDQARQAVADLAPVPR